MITEEIVEKLEVFSALSKMVDYNSESGVFIWKYRNENGQYERMFNTRFAGKECGSVNSGGYNHIRFTYRGKKFLIRAHRLAWFVHTGCMPIGEIDHINRDRLDNRIQNLRDVCGLVNKRNQSMPANNTSGATGITWTNHMKKWRARVGTGDGRKHIGYFEDIADAVAALNEARLQYGYTQHHGLKNTQLKTCGPAESDPYWAIRELAYDAYIGTPPALMGNK